MAHPSDLFPISTGRDENGWLTISGHPIPGLAEKFGTPLYLYDGPTIRGHIERLKNLLDEHYPGSSEVSYAAKAYFSLGFARKLSQLGLGVEVASSGEMKMAARAGFRPGKIHFHGNNKSPDELAEAVDEAIQAIVVDNLAELTFLEQLASERSKRVQIWLRLAPVVEVDTHPALKISTSHSKFGLGVKNGEAVQAIRQVMENRALHLNGLHVHLGSQIFAVEPYQAALRMLLEVAEQNGLAPREICPGGGWGVPYSVEDDKVDPQVWIQGIATVVREEYSRRNWRLPKLVIESGRWIAARAGLAVYTAGWSKKAADGSSIVAVDGGLADNPRTALYQARYTCLIAERPAAAMTERVRVVGKFCETGDELIEEAWLPEVEPGEHLVVPVSGAYQLSMASNYNLAPRPAVLWLEKGKVEVIQRREHPEEAGWWMGD